MVEFVVEVGDEDDEDGVGVEVMAGDMVGVVVGVVFAVPTAEVESWTRIKYRPPAGDLMIFRSVRPSPDRSMSPSGSWLWTRSGSRSAWVSLHGSGPVIDPLRLL